MKCRLLVALKIHLLLVVRFAHSNHFFFYRRQLPSRVNARQVKFTSFLAFTLVFHCLLDVHLMWEELEVVRISISPVGAGTEELLLMKLVRVIR